MNQWPLLRATVRAWLEDDAFRMAGALAFSAIMSMAPLLLLTLGVTEFVRGKQTAQGELQNQLEAFVGPEPAQAIEEIMDNMETTGGNGILTGINFAVFLFGSVWVVMALQDCLNSVWKVRHRAGLSWFLWMRGRLLLFTLVLGAGLLLLALLAGSVTLTALAGSLKTSRFSAGLMCGLNAGLSFVVITLVFALIYRFVPEANVRWRHVWVGALGSSLLHALGNQAIGLYLAHSALSSIYGTASSVMIILLWVYYSSLTFLMGAEYVHQVGAVQTAALAADKQPGQELEAPAAAGTDALAHIKANGKP
jgi:membrane protein